MPNRCVMRPVDAEELCRLVDNSKNGSIDCNDIMRAPCLDVIPIDWLEEERAIAFADISHRDFDLCHSIDRVIALWDRYKRQTERNAG